MPTVCNTLAREIEQEFPGIQIDVQVQAQYRNMAEGLQRDPRAVQYAQEAHRRLGRTPKLTIIRGGTDGSMLTARGLPTPNLSSGQHTPHSPLEWACLDEMVQALQVLVELVQVWCEPDAGQDTTEKRAKLEKQGQPPQRSRSPLRPDLWWFR